jgi:hypothetical protein
MFFVLDFSVCKEANKCCLFSRFLTAVQVKYEKLIRRLQITVLQFAVCDTYLFEAIARYKVKSKFN